MVRLGLAFSVLLVTLCSAKVSIPEQNQRLYPCPNLDDIRPCYCSVDHSSDTMTMDCSRVESEEQLRQIFTSHFPVTAFDHLTITDNKFVKVLRNRTFGPASFQVITINNGVLEEVEEHALSQSYSTLTEIDLIGNNVSKFPFEELNSFSILEIMHMDSNSLTTLPPMESESLQYLFLYENSIEEIAVGAFDGLSNLRYIAFESNLLQDFPAGSFSGFRGLYYVNIGHNQLTNLMTGAIELAGNRNGFVDLYYNKIESVAPGAITGLKDGALYIDHNSLTVFEEEAFRPILEEGAQIWMAGNPLDCECDIAWLVRNTTFMILTQSGSPTCADGRFLADLDPSIFDGC